MNVKVCIVLPLAVLLVAVCVSADRAHVEKVKGAHKNWGQMKALPRARAEGRGAGHFVRAADVPANAELLACTDVNKFKACLDAAGCSEACITACAGVGVGVPPVATCAPKCASESMACKDAITSCTASCP